MDLADKIVLVTGANGFIGSHLVKRLSQYEGARVRALTRKLPPIPAFDPPSGDVHYVQGDIVDPSAVAAAVAGCDIIVHTAACQPSTPLPPASKFNAVNVGGTENLLRAFDPDRQGRFLLLSTMNVHGLPPPLGASADSPLRYSGDRYSDSKVDGERVARRIARERALNLTVVRPVCTFGPYGAAWTIRPIERLKRGTPVLLGAGLGICNPVYVDNLVDLIILALKSDAAVDQDFIGSQGVGVEWSEFYGTYARMLNVRPRSIPFPAYAIAGLAARLFERATGRPGPISQTNIAFYSHKVTFDAAKNATLLGFFPRISFKEGMDLTEEWLRRRNLL